MKVPFTLATHAQIHDMYERKYTVDAKLASGLNSEHIEDLGDLDFNFVGKTSSQHAELTNMAEMFANELPDRTFSPAEIQDFLLTRKKDPWLALRQVDEWRDERPNSGTRKILLHVHGNDEQ